MIARCLDLTAVVDRVGATYDTERTQGTMNAWGNSVPAEELPFGGRVVVGGVPYALVDKPPATPSRPDHVEALGQRLPVDPPGRRAEAMAVLAGGELGPQELSLRVHLDGGIEVLTLTVPGWATRPEVPVAADELRFRHLHYPGDYGLALLLPVLWSRVVPLPGVTVTAVELLPNPLVHVFAVTLLTGADS